MKDDFETIYEIVLDELNGCYLSDNEGQDSREHIAHKITRALVRRV